MRSNDYADLLFHWANKIAKLSLKIKRNYCQFKCGTTPFEQIGRHLVAIVPRFWDFVAHIF